MSTQSVHHSCDVLIVGAGMSGLFAAWRLLNHKPDLNVVIVDKLNRTGGRLQTTTVSIRGTDGNDYDVDNEEGGMRFVPEGTGMPNLWRLFHELNLQPIPFPMGDENNRYFIRGRSFTKSKTPIIWQFMYNLAPQEQNKQPGDIFGEVLAAILAENKDLYTVAAGQTFPSTPDQWIQFRNTFTYKGVALHSWGLWTLLQEYGLTQECINWLDQAIGFMGPVDAFINAGEGLQIILDFPSAASFFTLPGGYQTLPDCLEHQIIQLGGDIILNKTIDSITDKGDYKLATGEGINYRAKQVILALPRKAIEKLADASPALHHDHKFMEAVGSVHNMELTKIGLYFDQRWWHDPAYGINISSGPSFSDLPAGSVYAFAHDPANPEADQKYNGPAALTIYTDFIRGNFWKELQNMGEPYHTVAFPDNPDNTQAATTPLVKEAMRLIKTIFGLNPDTAVPEPVLSTYRIWGQGEFGYGYHQYKLNVDDRQVYKSIWNPASGIYVCNEAWSPEQGWVEGSLLATEHVLQQGFKLDPFSAPHQDSPVVSTSRTINQY
ncbi:flavin monoamine oxidase family protein [Spirosoma fluviale]|uniref:Tryptophan 2-monooxygenase n=1 Tax=Spirosoma fluviale TaxID=1597977 RepID=A0A286GQK2_9BACT|nr:FAD-dependent oxidoreductase [Spirosoma fluviale]SOD97466.1 Monoamine oxidase [Spirosoma fluviale]